jgi:hypothetical protein
MGRFLQLMEIMVPMTMMETHLKLENAAWNKLNVVLPLVYQCRYSGINCPDDLYDSIYYNIGTPYYQGNMDPQEELIDVGDRIMEKLIDYIQENKPPKEYLDKV